MEFISRDYVKANRDKVFLFGDNLRGFGFGGQARQMRGEPNAIGIPTKKEPSMQPRSFFNDDEYKDNVKAIDQAFDKIPKDKIIVIPSDGIGTGLAELEKRAPETHRYLQERLAGLE